MFEHLADYARIIVTGPGRSGTTIATKMIAHDTGYRFLPEECYAVHDEAKFRQLLEEEADCVIHGPAMQFAVHTPGIGDREDTAIIFMHRPLHEILASQLRVGWDYNVLALGKWGLTEGINAEVRHMAWYMFQSKMVKNPFVVHYQSLESHPLWLPAEKRKDFGMRQIHPDQPHVVPDPPRTS